MRRGARRAARRTEILAGPGPLCGSSAIWSIADRTRSRCCAASALWAMPPRSPSAITTCTCWPWRSAGARLRGDDTLTTILAAPDRDALLEWLASGRCCTRIRALNVCMVHAGLAPQWDCAGWRGDCAREFESALRRDPEQAVRRTCTATSRIAGTRPCEARSGCASSSIASRGCATWMREGRLVLRAKGSPKKGADANRSIPWFEAPRRALARAAHRLRPLVDPGFLQKRRRDRARHGLRLGRHASPRCAWTCRDAKPVQVACRVQTPPRRVLARNQRQALAARNISPRTQKRLPLGWIRHAGDVLLQLRALSFGRIWRANSSTSSQSADAHVAKGIARDGERSRSARRPPPDRPGAAGLAAAPAMPARRTSMFKLGPSAARPTRAAGFIAAQQPRCCRSRRAPRSSSMARTLSRKPIAGIARRAAHVGELQMLLLPDRRQAGCRRPWSAGQGAHAQSKPSQRTRSHTRKTAWPNLRPVSTAPNAVKFHRPL